jgi:hypothetical protein
LLTMPVHVQLWQCDLCRTSRQCQSRTLYPMILREAGDQGCYVYPGTAPWCFWVCFPQAIESRNPLMAWWLRFPPCPKTLFWIGYASWRLVALAYYLFIYVSIYIYILHMRMSNQICRTASQTNQRASTISPFPAWIPMSAGWYVYIYICVCICDYDLLCLYTSHQICIYIYIQIYI